jgi:hypothetical protein
VHKERNSVVEALLTKEQKATIEQIEERVKKEDEKN